MMWLINNELCHKKQDLSVIQFAVLKKYMCNHQVVPDVRYFYLKVSVVPYMSHDMTKPTK